MKREILFRGKTIDGIWCFGDLIHIGGGALIYHGDKQELESIPQEDSPCAVGFYPNEISPVIPKTVGQFTGLTDKNGKMIFEGDVLCRSRDGRGIDKKKIIKWNDAYVATGFNLNSTSQNKEIIGNVHDNPELI